MAIIACTLAHHSGNRTDIVQMAMTLDKMSDETEIIEVTWDKTDLLIGSLKQNIQMFVSM
jgi:hypothetical protein